MNFDGIIETTLEYWLGTDKIYDFTVYTSSAKTAIRDVTGYTTSFKVKTLLSDADSSAILTASGTVSGVFNSSPSVNTQKISVTLVDTDTDTEITPKVAYWELKRTDAGSEATLAFGRINLRRAVHIS
jgi:hypothetical protein